MFRRLALALAAACLVAAPAALAAFPSPMAQQGVVLHGPDTSLGFVARPDGSGTTVSAQRPDGTTVRSQALPGTFGIPVLTPNGPPGGLFRDGSAFVLQSMGYGPRTEFRIVSTGDLGVRDAIALKGTFAFDALAPDGSRLYLIQHRSTRDLQHYVVRAYDLRTNRLLPGRIADKTQRGWVMQGFPAGRVSTADGRWVYTLYSNPGGYPFVHALDTVRGVAHCVGFAWATGNVFDLRMSLQGRKLVLRLGDGRLYRVIDRRTWRVTAPKA